ncbi:MAG: CpsB/CapC family capsule biosynthesis tyrosine phosphatase [Candidatus Cloacimonadaceae bacterium]
MIDCHTHIIPNIDDGSTSLESSLEALRQMADGGIKSVICTSHYMRGLYQFKPEDYTAKFRELEAEIKHQNIPITIYPGAEVFVTAGITEDIMANNLTLADSSYVLIESDLNGFPPDFQKNIYLMLRAGLRPILAHAERYVPVMMKTHNAKDMINRSVYIQINAASLVGGYGDKVKHTAWKLLNKGWVHFMGSDHHNKTDYKAFFQAKDKITAHIDSETAEFLTRTHPTAIIKNDKVSYEYVMVYRDSRKKFPSRLFKSLGV